MDKKNNWKIMAAIALLMGLFLIFIAPGLFDTTMETLILKQSKQATNITSGHLSRLYVGSFYSGIEMLVGLALVIVAYPLYVGKKWAWSTAMLLVSIPAMVNGYIGLGWLENLKKFPPAYITFFLSLAVFWIFLFLKKNDKKVKNAMFWVFTLLGMLGAQGFMLFPHALRVILKSPADSVIESGQWCSPPHRSIDVPGSDIRRTSHLEAYPTQRIRLVFGNHYWADDGLWRFPCSLCPPISCLIGPE